VHLLGDDAQFGHLQVLGATKTNECMTFYSRSTTNLQIQCIKNDVDIPAVENDLLKSVMNTVPEKVNDAMVAACHLYDLDRNSMKESYDKIQEIETDTHTWH